MNILIVQERGRHELNWEFREALSFQRAFTKIGHKAIVWGLNYDTFVDPIKVVVEREHIDVLFILENYDTGWVPDMSELPVLRVMWSIDSHCALNEHLKTADRQKVHVLLNSTAGYISHFEKPGRKCYWFPNAYDDDLIKPLPDVPKAVPLGFCGNYVNRKEWVDFLKEKRGLKADIFVIGHDMVRTINSYQIQFNRNMADDCNYRNFETMGCGTMLLTNQVPGMDRLFEIWGDMAVYTSREDLLEKVDYYRSHDSDRIQMSMKGVLKVKNNHTYWHRAQWFLDMVGA